MHSSIELFPYKQKNTEYNGLVFSFRSKKFASLFFLQFRNTHTHINRMKLSLECIFITQSNECNRTSWSAHANLIEFVLVSISLALPLNMKCSLHSFSLLSKEIRTNRFFSSLLLLLARSGMRAIVFLLFFFICCCYCWCC